MITKAIVGICKNAGKTTVLNHHLNKSNGSYAITSVGLDGESKDQFFSNEKPRIFVKEDSIIATSIASLKRSDITFEVLNITNIMTALGSVAIVKTLSAGYVEIAGPTSSNDITMIREWIYENCEVDILYVDGALSRKQFSSIPCIDNVDIVMGACYNQNISKTFDEAKLWNRMYKLPQKDVDNIADYNVIINDKCYSYDFLDVELLSDITSDSTDFIYLNCIVKSDIFNYLLSFNRKNEVAVVVENPNKLFITLNDFNKLDNSSVKLFVRNELVITGVYVNPIGHGYSYDKQDFKTGISQIFECDAIDVGDYDEL